MTITNSSGKFGQSMDISQYNEMKRRYATVARQNAKAVPGSQGTKPMLNKDQQSRGAENGYKDLYMTRGLITEFRQFRVR